jgi:trans-aconitate 2-methyltransferase
VSATAYAFRDSPLAEARLALVAEIFDPTSAALLLDWAPREPQLAVDLGCGPGFTTRLLEDTVHPHALIGIDSSAGFLASAARRVPSAIYIEQDLNEPLRLAAAPSLAFSRLVLGHLEDPLTTLEGWADALAPGGRLLVDEVEAIETDDQAFAAYLDSVRELLGARGHRMEIGPLLSSRMPERAVHSRIVRVAPGADRAGRMFRANLAVFADDPVVADRARELDAALAGARGRIEWQLRQLVIEGRNPQ